MSNALPHLLAHWEERKHETEWVLGTVYKTEGSAYRKAGAMMLINGHGELFGLLSGGCLEADIQLRAKQVMQRGRAQTVVYDGTDEDDLSFQLGIGCGGTVYILLQPLTPEDDLGLGQVTETLRARENGLYRQLIPGRSGDVKTEFVRDPANRERPLGTRGKLVTTNDETWLETPIMPQPHLLIAGGGIDARPLADLAHSLGWEVTLADPRAANARREFFMTAGTILRDLGEPLADYVRENKVDAAVVMTHSVTLDAETLKTLSGLSLGYVALLGPDHRRQEVLEAAGLDGMENPFSVPLSGPAGLKLGGELPESVALCMISECHAALYRSDAASLSLSRDDLSKTRLQSAA